VPAARHLCVAHIHGVLGTDAGSGDVIDDCALIISELVANAVNAGSSLIIVDVSVHRDHIRLSVVDDAAGTPLSQNAAPADTHGRGLRIVEALARSCGVLTVAGGKEVWAELALPAGSWAFDCQLPIAG
jgi:anti-sigma regulatory factor (Ser/Thr protein kinase)